MRLRTPPNENVAALRLPTRLDLQSFLARWGRHLPLRLDTDLNMPVAVRDVASLFTPEYLRENMVDLGIRGADSPTLRQAMLRLAEDPLNASSELLAEIAGLRGRDPAELAAEYVRFRQCWEADRGTQGREAPPSLSRANSYFMAALSQLRCGALIGKALGIDAVFGALLNPSGGLVGMGNAALDFDSCGLGYHGVTHDAAGYLLNYAQVGPGYDYLGRERGLGASPQDERIGHREGLYFWSETIGSDPATHEAEQLANAALPAYQAAAAAAELRERLVGVRTESLAAAASLAMGVAAAKTEAAQGRLKAGARLVEGTLQATRQLLDGDKKTALLLAQSLGTTAHAAASGSTGAVARVLQGTVQAGSAVARATAEASRALVAGVAAAHVPSDFIRTVGQAHVSLSQGATQAVARVTREAVLAGAQVADGARQTLVRTAADALEIGREALLASQRADASLAACGTQASQIQEASRDAASGRLSQGTDGALRRVEIASSSTAQLARDLVLTATQQLRALMRRWDDL